jgi:chromate transporter
VSFGGGYAMIPLIQESVISFNWLTEEEILNFIAIAESTPGPIAINMATFVGVSQGGILGAMLATIGVVLPSFVVILLVSVFMKNLLSLTPIKAFLNGIKPVITALILSTALTLFLSVVFAIKSISSIPLFNYMGLIILGIIATIYFVFLKWKKKALSPIILICISGVLGMLFYGF